MQNLSVHEITFKARNMHLILRELLSQKKNVCKLPAGYCP